MTPSPNPSSGSGLNTAPGSHDDGWVSPPAVPMRDGTLIQLFKDGEGVRAAYDLIRAATTRICLEMYIFADDATGRAFADLLCEKSRQGVTVHVIYDSLGSYAPKRNIMKQLRRAGVRLAEFNPINPWRCKFAWRPFTRDHRKLLIVDSDFAWLGGLNIGDEYAGTWVAESSSCPTKVMRDTAIVLRGPQARHLLRSFARTWSYVAHGGPIKRALFNHDIRIGPQRKGARIGKPQPADDTPHDPALLGDMGILASVPTLVSPLRNVLQSLLRGAQTDIRMIMAYFAPDDELVNELCRAARRGVNVELIFAAKSDLNIMTIAARSFYSRLMDAGVKIYERQGGAARKDDDHRPQAGRHRIDKPRLPQHRVQPRAVHAHRLRHLRRPRRRAARPRHPLLAAHRPSPVAKSPANGQVGSVGGEPAAIFVVSAGGAIRDATAA
jgi:cardiolipin synthase A/B